MPRIALIHAVQIAIEPIKQAFTRLWPEADCVNLLDDALSPDLEQIGALDEKMFQRIQGLADLAVNAGADGILFTCSAFGPAISQAAKQISIPVLRPNQAMFETALQMGNKIAMLATFPPSVPSMEQEFVEMSAKLNPNATISTYCVPHAIDAAKSGNIDRHDNLVAEAAERFKDFDAVMLAHFSTSTARDLVEQRIGRKVLTSPDAAVNTLRQVLLSEMKSRG